MPNSRFEYRGDLATTPLPEVLETVYRYRVPGVLSVTCNHVEKKIFIWGEDVIFASSGDRADSLGDYLLRIGRITQDQLDQSVEILLFSGGEKRHGTVLVEMGVLSPQDLFEIVVAQVRSIVHSVFDLEEGDVSFEVGQYKTDELIQLNIPLRQMVLEGVKAVHDARRMVAYLGPSWSVFDPSFVAAEMNDLSLEVGEIRLLSAVDGLKTLRELVVLGPGDASHNAKLLYAFFALKLITRREVSVRSVKKIQWKTSGSDFGTSEKSG